MYIEYTCEHTIKPDKHIRSPEAGFLGSSKATWKWVLWTELVCSGILFHWKSHKFSHIPAPGDCILIGNLHTYKTLIILYHITQN